MKYIPNLSCATMLMIVQLLFDCIRNAPCDSSVGNLAVIEGVSHQLLRFSGQACSDNRHILNCALRFDIGDFSCLLYWFAGS